MVVITNKEKLESSSPILGEKRQKREGERLLRWAGLELVCGSLEYLFNHGPIYNQLSSITLYKKYPYESYYLPHVFIQIISFVFFYYYYLEGKYWQRSVTWATSLV